MCNIFISTHSIMGNTMDHESNLHMYACMWDISMKAMRAYLHTLCTHLQNHTHIHPVHDVLTSSHVFTCFLCLISLHSRFHCIHAFFAFTLSLHSHVSLGSSDVFLFNLSLILRMAQILRPASKTSLQHHNIEYTTPPETWQSLGRA